MNDSNTIHNTIRDSYVVTNLTTPWKSPESHTLFYVVHQIRHGIPSSITVIGIYNQTSSTRTKWTTGHKKRPNRKQDLFPWNRLYYLLYLWD